MAFKVTINIPRTFNPRARTLPKKEFVEVMQVIVHESVKAFMAKLDELTPVRTGFLRGSQSVVEDQLDRYGGGGYVKSAGFKKYNFANDRSPAQPLLKRQVGRRRVLKGVSLNKRKEYYQGILKTTRSGRPFVKVKMLEKLGTSNNIVMFSYRNDIRYFIKIKNVNEKLLSEAVAAFNITLRRVGDEMLKEFSGSYAQLVLDEYARIISGGAKSAKFTFNRGNTGNKPTGLSQLGV